jgi:hypothetical protein
MKVNPAIPPKGSSHAAESSVDFLFSGKFVPVTDAQEIVSVEAAVPDPGVMVAGEKAQLSALEKPLQESAMGLSKDPDRICAVTVNVPDLPDGMMTDAGDALKDKVGDRRDGGVGRGGRGVGGGGGGGGGGATVAAHDGL